LTATSHASLVTRQGKGAWSYATVWRVADRAGIVLTAGHETMGQWGGGCRRSGVVVIEARRSNPAGTQEQITVEDGA
jgi:hypothetical protein